MNFLAHAYLSGSDEETLVGNFIGDFVKGRRFLDFPHGIQKGILLHRSIDSYTDRHPIIGETKKIFYPTINHYAMVVVDLVFDHLLARNWNLYYQEPLGEFTVQTYRVLDGYSAIFPYEFSLVFDRMKKQDWLRGYSHEEGLEASLNGLNYRSPNYTGVEETMAIFRRNHEWLDGQFRKFFKEARGRFLDG